ncbi:hypothetical protein ACWGRK_09815 [Saccharomonospora azurea]|uniref:Uncharacterized protein n=1 Tax=Saccharomonospora azurea NA-128 TaxID=882081 RepID=H8GE86_9PSEU|nr:hypothetical protein [Saccharomonospora azurea]EHK89413.1 hypothetical protein SZMC14600_00980 [Saccharomonospora azurea SZMC 14600]EHY90968.1 hypothetical protein SacazDRAFT_04118 [Saccharomonospora azurea NA-128]
MLSRRRIRIALVALLVLALVGWFAQQAFGVGNVAPIGGSLPGAVPITGDVPTCEVLAVPQPDGAILGTRETLVVQTSAGHCEVENLQHVTVDMP